MNDKQGPLCVPNHMYRHSDIHSKLPLKSECSTPKTRENVSIWSLRSSANSHRPKWYELYKDSLRNPYMWVKESLCNSYHFGLWEVAEDLKLQIEIFSRVFGVEHSDFRGNLLCILEWRYMWFSTHSGPWLSFTRACTFIFGHLIYSLNMSII